MALVAGSLANSPTASIAGGATLVVNTGGLTLNSLVGGGSLLAGTGVNGVTVNGTVAPGDYDATLGTNSGTLSIGMPVS